VQQLWPRFSHPRTQLYAPGSPHTLTARAEFTMVANSVEICFKVGEICALRTLCLRIPARRLKCGKIDAGEGASAVRRGAESGRQRPRARLQRPQPRSAAGDFALGVSILDHHPMYGRRRGEMRACVLMRV
jgi:hypothetical protein